MENLNHLPQFDNCPMCHEDIETSFAPGPTEGTVVMKVLIPIACPDEELCHTRVQDKAKDVTGLNVHNLGYADGG